MNAKPLVTKNDTDDSQQWCKGCEKNVPSSLFITNGKSYKTCNICRAQNKAFYRQKSQKFNDDQILIEFYDLSDFISEVFNEFENEATENQENEDVFAFSCTTNIITLEGNDSKEKADHIIKVISDVDEYVWM